METKTKEYPIIDEELVIDLAFEIQMIKNPRVHSVSWESRKEASEIFHKQGFGGAMDKLVELREKRGA